MELADKEVTVLRLEPDDVIVLEIDEVLTVEQAKKLQQHAIESFGTTRKVVVLSGGIRLQR